jgi:hypothetical protein
VFRFVANQNLSRFEDQLRIEGDLSKRYLLRKLLVEEVDRFADRSERLQMAERHIEACNAHISRQKLLVQRLSDGGNPARIREAKRVLINLLELRDLYETAREVVADGGKRSLI